MTKQTFSDIGRKLTAHCGIYSLMEDLGGAIGRPDAIMMGGGNPAHIPEVESVWRRRLSEILVEPGAMEHMLGDYDGSQGKLSFLKTAAEYFNRSFGWEIGPENIAVTAGSQMGFFQLFNLLSGVTEGRTRRILFPIAPEYIGYVDQGLAPAMFTALRPKIDTLGPHRFKYRIDFDALRIDDTIAAMCLSRPTNPSGNVATNEELARLLQIAEEASIPLLIDNAYGAPFPDVLFKDAALPWSPAAVYSFSLSKLGLPTTRTGLIVADARLISALATMNATMALANGSIGQVIVEPLLASGEIDRLCREVIRPFYENRSRLALASLDEAFRNGAPYEVHESEGAFFLWVRFPQLRITDRELYQRLKNRGLVVVPGSYFFPGFDEPWEHRTQCLRLSYCLPEERLHRGMQILAEEAALAS